MPTGAVVEMAMDEYLKGVVPHEVPPSWPRESLRAQAVAARSYASTRFAHGDQGADVCTTTHCQVWRPTHYDTTDRAVNDTHGVVARYNGAIIYAFFFGHCDGHTRNSQDVWGGYLPYCQGVVCPCGFTTMWGHGVGMCQEGARVLAQQGHSFQSILQHYYLGVQVPSRSPGRLVNATLSPLEGDTNTLFTYEARYRSILADVPAAAHVIIDGRSHGLLRVPDTSGGDWIYRLTTRLPQGQHTFRFFFDDGYDQVSTVPPVAGAYDGPTVVAADPAQPAPTPGPGPLEGARVQTLVHSTAEDWADGTFSGIVATPQGDGALTLASGMTQGTYTSAALLAPWPYTGVGFLWQTGQPAGVSLALRTSVDGVAWSPWQPRPATEDGPQRHGLVSADLWFAPGAYVQYRVTLSGASTVLESLRLVFVAAEDAAPATRGSVIITRQQWGADEAVMTWPAAYRAPQTIILHHTGSAPDETAGPAAMRVLYAYDTIARERGDLGYNFVIDAQGRIYEGRAGGPGAVGAHAGRFDWGSIGIALMGDFSAQPPTAAARGALTDLMAQLCREQGLDPLGQSTLVDKPTPNITTHRALAGTVCPGGQLEALLPTLRQETLAKLQAAPPTLELIAPQPGQAVSGVFQPDLAVTGVITRVAYYVDDVLRATEATLPGGWRWNTTLEADGPYTLRIVAANALGEQSVQAQVQVDNTAPTGAISVPAWVNNEQVPFSVADSDATHVQFSNAWRWEGEALPHAAGTGLAVADAQAANGLAWLGRGGVDAPGAWYGPYTCALPGGRAYTVVHRLKVSANDADVGLATLDVADDQGRRIFGERPLSALDFARVGAYQDVALALPYTDQAPTCAIPGAEDGLEFRVWFSGAGDLYWDRVTVFGALEPLTVPITWLVPSVEGEQIVIVRLLDAAGNATEREVLVRLDLTSPIWATSGDNAACATDALSGPDGATAEWALSHDGGQTWSGWQPVAQVTYPEPGRACLAVTPTGGTHLRFRIADMAGNSSISAPQPAVWATPGPSPTPTLTLTPTSTPSPRPTLPRRLELPLVLRGD
jgi:hypothetical protein